MIGSQLGDVDFRRGMHVVITGSGSALIDPNRGNASTAVVVDGVVLQFDAGRGMMEGLARVGIDPVDVDHLFITHLHFDHIASYGYFLISSWIAGRQTPLQVAGPVGTEAMSDGALTGTHAVDVDYVHHLVDSWDLASRPVRPTAEPPVQVRDLSAGVALDKAGIRVSAVDSVHFNDMGIRSLAYRVESEYGSVVVSGDCHPSQATLELSRGVDVLVHECAKPDGDMLEGVGRLDDDADGHTTPTKLGQFAAQAGVKTVVATHLAPVTGSRAAAEMSKLYYGVPTYDDFWGEFEARIRKGFDGDVKLAADGMVLTVGR